PLSCRPSFAPPSLPSLGPNVPDGAMGWCGFAGDRRQAKVEVQFQNIDLREVNMFHLHCGRPGVLGPILVDFALTGDLAKNLADGTFSVNLTDADIAKTLQSGKGAVGTFLVGCPVVPGLPAKVTTLAEAEKIARSGELYFNLHTYGQTYYGYMRGQLAQTAQP
ncbi:MAG: CHRD domain-containing protein, partial [Oscillatoriales cyanobacterium SM2_1_8]|nr:CHRD domain-containing protein [Oscillatoriales cyanobacterium SM2_1_8]